MGGAGGRQSRSLIGSRSHPPPGRSHEKNLLDIGGVFLVFASAQLQAGASCVVAKRLGDSLAIEWVAAEIESAESATRQATRRLRQRGFQGKYQDVHPQASSELPHAHVVIVKTTYTTLIGKPRTSYGCGFSAHSVERATELALYNLRNYSWGWKPEFGYRVERQLSY